MPVPRAALAVLLLLGACAEPIPYQPAAVYGTGFSEVAIEANRYRVAVRGNAATPVATLELHLLYRAAELTRQSGFDWFRIVGPAQATGAAPEAGAGVARAGKRGGHRGGHRSGHRGGARPDYRAHGGYAARARPRRYRGHAYRRHYRRKRSGVVVGVGTAFVFGPAFYGVPYASPYYPVPYGYGGPSEIAAEIQMFRGAKPAADPDAYDAAEVLARLRPVIAP